MTPKPGGRKSLLHRVERLAAREDVIDKDDPFAGEQCLGRFRDDHFGRSAELSEIAASHLGLFF